MYKNDSSLKGGIDPRMVLAKTINNLISTLIFNKRCSMEPEFEETISKMNTFFQNNVALSNIYLQKFFWYLCSFEILLKFSHCPFISKQFQNLKILTFFISKRFIFFVYLLSIINKFQIMASEISLENSLPDKILLYIFQFVLEFYWKQLVT